ncbi:MAG: VWA domain-containing protein [Pirellula sp.]
MNKPPPLSPPPLRIQIRESEASFRLLWLIAAAAMLGLLLSVFLLVWLLSQDEVGQGATADSAGGGGSQVANLDTDDSREASSAEVARAVSKSTSTEEEAESKRKDSAPESDSDLKDQLTESMEDSVHYEEPVLLVVEEKPSPKATRSGSRGSASSGQILATPGGVNPFLGTGSPAKSNVFVIDISGSMQTVDRLPRVMATLKRAIDQLKPEQKFMVVLFDDTVHTDPSSSGLVLANKKNVERVYQWLDMPQFGGGTNPLPAMLFALQSRPERIVLLSDGEFDPTFANTITQANRSNQKPAKIDCVGLMEVVEVLKQIATSNKGIYYQAN